MKQFKNQGWRHWDKLEQAHPGQLSGGNHVFTPSVNTVPPPLHDTDNTEDDAAPSGEAGCGGTVPLTTASVELASTTSTTLIAPSDISSSGISAVDSTTSTLLSSVPSSSSRSKAKRHAVTADVDTTMLPPPAKKEMSLSSRLSSAAESTSSSSGIKGGQSSSMCIMINKMDNMVTHMMDMFKDNMSSDRGKAINTIQREVKSETNTDGWTVEEVG